MVKKKKLVVHILLKHNLRDTWYDVEWDMYTGICACSEEFQGNYEEIDKLHAEHVYRKIKSALKKRKKVQAFFPPAVTMPPTNIF